MTKKIVAVTACPTGVAHTFMAAEALEIEARKRGDWIKVETRGSVGAKNTLTAEEIAQADVVIIAADIELDLSGFVGKRLYRTSTGAAQKRVRRKWIMLSIAPRSIRGVPGALLQLVKQSYPAFISI